MSNTKVRDMTKGSPLKLLLLFSLPVLLGNVFQQLYNMVDTIIVGQYLGYEALAAVGTTGSLNFLVLGFANGLTSGFAVLVAQRFGAKDEAGLKKAEASAVNLSVGFTVVITLLALVTAKPLLRRRLSFVIVAVVYMLLLGFLIGGSADFFYICKLPFLAVLASYILARKETKLLNLYIIILNILIIAIATYPLWWNN